MEENQRLMEKSEGKVFEYITVFDEWNDDKECDAKVKYINNGIYAMLCNGRSKIVENYPTYYDIESFVQGTVDDMRVGYIKRELRVDE